MFMVPIVLCAYQKLFFIMAVMLLNDGFVALFGSDKFVFYGKKINGLKLTRVLLNWSRIAIAEYAMSCYEKK